MSGRLFEEAGNRLGAAIASYESAGFLRRLGRLQEALRASERAESPYLDLGEARKAADAANLCGLLHMDARRLSDSLAAFARAKERYRRVGDRRRMALVDCNRVLVLARAGRHAEVLGAAEEIEPELEAAGNWGALASSGAPASCACPKGSRDAAGQWPSLSPTTSSAE